MPSRNLGDLKFYGTNAVRVLSIVTLTLVFASSIVVMVDDVNAVRRGSDMPTGTLTDASGEEFELDCDYFEGSTVPLQPAGIFFAIMNRLFIIFQCIILVLSEVGWPQRFFEHFLPVLGPNHGVGILGAMQVFLGAAVLSHHVPTFALVSAFFLFSIGILNIFLGLIFRSDIKDIRARRNTSPSLPIHIERSASVYSDSKHSVYQQTGIFNSSSITMEGKEKSEYLPGYDNPRGYSSQSDEKAFLQGHVTAQPEAAAQKNGPRPLLLTTKLSGRSSPDSTRSAPRF